MQDIDKNHFTQVKLPIEEIAGFYLYLFIAVFHGSKINGSNFKDSSK